MFGGYIYFDHLQLSLLGWLIGTALGTGVIYLASLIVKDWLSHAPALRRYLLLVPWRTPVVMLLAICSLPLLSQSFDPLVLRSAFTLPLVAGAIMCLVVLFLPVSLIREWPAQSRLILLSGVLRTLAAWSIVAAILVGFYTGDGMGDSFMLALTQPGWEPYEAEPEWNQTWLFVFAIDMLFGLVQFALWKPVPQTRESIPAPDLG